MTMTPGYSWRLDLDVLFDGARPVDWPDWTVRMHVWSYARSFTLAPGSGVAFEPVADLPGADEPIVIPVIRMDEARTAMMTEYLSAQYIIDLAAPDGVAEDYFAGSITLLAAPPFRGLR